LLAHLHRRLYTELVKDSVNELAYDAELAGLGYDIGSWNLGIMITFWGYNDKLAVLGKHLVEHARNLQIKPDRLEVMKEQARSIGSVEETLLIFRHTAET
jgi:insulysin